MAFIVTSCNFVPQTFVLQGAVLFRSTCLFSLVPYVSVILAVRLPIAIMIRVCRSRKYKREREHLLPQNHWVSELCPSSGILNTRKHNFRKLDVFPFSGEEWETPTLLGPVEKANLNKWTVRSQSQSHVTTDGQSVSQYILVWSPLWNLWPDITFCLKVAVLSLWGALSDERSGLSLASYCQQYLVHCQNLIQFIFYVLHMFYV
jgi:hypothetical protein